MNKCIDCQWLILILNVDRTISKEEAFFTGKCRYTNGMAVRQDDPACPAFVSNQVIQDKPPEEPLPCQ